MEGKVKFFNDQKGWGFITDTSTGTEYYFHTSNTLDKVTGNDPVLFDIVEGKRGPKAINIKLSTNGNRETKG